MQPALCTKIFSRFFLVVFLFCFYDVALAEKDVPFDVVGGGRVFLDEDSIVRSGNFVTFTYRIDVDSSRHPWKFIKREAWSECGSQNFRTLKVILHFKEGDKEIELTGGGESIQPLADSYRYKITQYACEHAPAASTPEEPN
jgi:hypothetical protein